MDAAGLLSRGAANVRWRAVVLLLAVSCSAAADMVPAFTVRSADTTLIDKVYHFNARIDYHFSDEALEALDNGVPLVVELAIDIEHTRDYLWNESLASLRQRYQLSYEPLTRRYVVTNLNSGADTYYSGRAAAVAAMGDVVDLPILDAGLLIPGQRYQVRLQASLDLDALPVPMRVIGYFSSKWSISSEWYAWPLR